MRINFIRFFKEYWLLAIFLLVKIVLQYLVLNPVYGLHRDEFLYLDQAHHPALGYISVPPMISWFSSLIYLLGGSLFWIRFFPAFFGALTLLITWLIIGELEGTVYAKVLVSCALIFSVFTRLNILFQPNAFDILAWTAVFYFLVKYIHTRKPIWVFMMTLALVLGLYNKYTIGFLLTGLFAGMVLTRERQIFTRKYFWVFLAAGLILLLPNLIWQMNNRFPFTHHMQALKETQLVNDNAAGFLLGQVMYYNGSLALILAGLVSFWAYKPFKTYRATGITFFMVIVFLLIFRAKSYYASGLYPMIFAFGAVYLEKILPELWKKIVFALLAAGNIALFIYSFDIVYPVLTPPDIIAHKAKFERFGMLKWEDGKNHDLPQDFADMLGWKEMAAKALKVYDMIPETEKPSTMIICDNYGEAGALNYYNRDKMPEAYAFNTDYIFWIPLMPEIRNLLLVGHPPSEQIIRMFSCFEKTDSLTDEYSRERMTGIYLFTGANKEFTSQFYELRSRRIRAFEIF